MRRRVPDIGTIKSRRAGMYCSEISELNDHNAVLPILAFLLEKSDDEERKRSLLFIIMILSARIEDLKRDIVTISEPVERRYLRFHSNELNDRFTIQFRFRREHMDRLMR